MQNLPSSPLPSCRIQSSSLKLVQSSSPTLCKCAKCSFCTSSRRTHSSGSGASKEEKGGTRINRTKRFIEETSADNESIEGTTVSPSSSSRWKRWKHNKSEKEKQPFIAKPSRMVQRSSLGIIEGDGDVWMEVPCRSRKTVLNSIFISVDSGKLRREPPTGASRIIHMPV